MKQKNLILMGVAVGCGLVAAVLTARMNAGPAPVEKVEVVVPSKDIAVGTMITKEDLPKMFTRRAFPKDGLPPNIVESEEELIDKRVARNYSAGEPVKREDLKKGAVVSIPPGYQMIAQSFSVPQAVAGFVTPGSRVDVLGTVRLGNRVRAFPVLVNMLILAVDTSTTLPQDKGTFANLNTVSFAVDQKQALVLQLARARGAEMTLLLRNPNEPVNENDRRYNIDDVIKYLQDNQNPSDVIPTEDSDPRRDQLATPKKDPVEQPAIPPVGPGVPPVGPGVPPVSPKPETDKVLVATAYIAPGTEITEDLLTDKFAEVELPRGLADGVVNPKNYPGKFIKNGLAKGQWLTIEGLTDSSGKRVERDAADLPKPDPTPVAGPPVIQPANPGTPVKRRYHDVFVHTASGTKVYRYEVLNGGEYRFVGEFAPGTPMPDDRPRTNSKVD
jgi:Flp pilus assembly protein CpaB